MIARIQGDLVEVNEDNCILMCSGIGYELNCSLSTLADLMEKKGQIITLQVYTHVREDALQLFGFSAPLEKSMFLSLLKVNGIGPKSALNILGGATVNQILMMIESEDVKALSKLPKVGKKTAEQMILSLKGKLVLGQEEKAGKKAPNSVQSQVSSALINLGFRSVDVEKVVGSMDFVDPVAGEKISLEEGIRQGLAALTSI